MYLERKLSESLIVYKNLRFGLKKQRCISKRYGAVVGVGGNLGDVRRRFTHLLHVLEKDKRVDLVQSSSILKNPPFGFLDQDDFFNAVIVLQVNMQARSFLHYLLRLEKRFARKRSFANAPRTLDLDIIFFDDRVIDTKDLVVPHPEWSKRESVVIPLASLR